MGVWYYRVEFCGPGLRVVRARDVGPTPERFPSLARSVEIGTLDDARTSVVAMPENWETTYGGTRWHLSPEAALLKAREEWEVEARLAAEELADARERLRAAEDYRIPPH